LARNGKRKIKFLANLYASDAQTIAIEPMTCLPDAFNNKTGLISLQPGKNRFGKLGRYCFIQSQEKKNNPLRARRKFAVRAGSAHISFSVRTQFRFHRTGLFDYF